MFKLCSSPLRSIPSRPDLRYVRHLLLILVRDDDLHEEVRQLADVTLREVAQLSMKGPIEQLGIAGSGLFGARHARVVESDEIARGVDTEC